MAVSKVNQAIEKDVIQLDRRTGDRRSRNSEARDSSDIRAPRRRKQRRRHIDPTTCERDYSDPEIEFMRAMDVYKRDSGRMFPTCSEVLEVIRALGYHQLSDEQAAQLNLVRVEEFAEVEHEDEQCDEALA